MQVVFLPDYRRHNPYQSALAESLKREGVRVVHAVECANSGILAAVAASTIGDILHIHWTQPLLKSDSAAGMRRQARRVLRQLRMARLAGLRVVWTIHNLYSHESGDRQSEQWFYRRLVRLCDAVIVHCESARRAVVSEYGLTARQAQKLRVIPHGHYIGLYPNTITPAAAKEKLGLTSREFVFLNLGQLRPYKGLERLIEVFREMLHEHLRLVIAGMPPSTHMKKHLEQLAAADPRVILRLNFVPDDELQVYLNACDVVVLPYREILTSGAAVLAMSFGRAVVAPRLGCLPDLLAGGQPLLYDPEAGNAAIVAALTAAMHSDVTALGNGNYHRVLALDWQLVGELTHSAYRQSYVKAGRARTMLRNVVARASSAGRWSRARDPWRRRTNAVRKSVLAHSGAGESIVLIDEQQLCGIDWEGRRIRPFVEREGTYWGAPVDDDAAVKELERIADERVRLLVLTWPSFWWREHYPRLFERLRSRYRIVSESDDAVVFDLSPGRRSGREDA